MTVKIGHARSDENGKARGGKPGDQTGKEICIQNWHNRDGGWGAYLECKDDALADKFATFMEQICNDDDFGYDQGDRKTGYQAIVAAGSIAGAGPSEFDCSSLVYACILLAGITVPLGSTHSMEQTLLDTDMFFAYHDAAHIATADYAKRGGIYLKAGKHVAMVLTDGPKAGQSAIAADIAAEADDIQTPYVLLLGNVRVRSGPGTQYPKLFTGKKGNKYPYNETDADTGWHIISTSKGDGYVSGKTQYTKLVIE